MKIEKYYNKDFANVLLNLKLGVKNNFHQKGDRYFVLKEDSILFGIAKLTKKGRLIKWWRFEYEKELMEAIQR